MAIYFDGTNKKHVLTAVDVRNGGGSGDGKLYAHYLTIAPSTTDPQTGEDIEDTDHRQYFRIVSTRDTSYEKAWKVFNEIFCKTNGTDFIYPENVLSLEYLASATYEAIDDGYQVYNAKRIIDGYRNATIGTTHYVDYYHIDAADTSSNVERITDDYYVWHDNFRELTDTDEEEEE